MHWLITIAIILLILSLLCKRIDPPKQKIEGYDTYYYVDEVAYPYILRPGVTTNMSYDLRGDIPIENHFWFPYNMSSVTPIMNRNLYSIS